MLCGEATNTNFIVFGLTQSGKEGMNSSGLCLYVKKTNGSVKCLYSDKIMNCMLKYKNKNVNEW